MRRKAFSADITAAHLAAANVRLEQTCRHLNKRRARGRSTSISTEMGAERAAMKALPPRPYDTADVRACRVDKYGCVRVDNNGYSVPDDQVGWTEIFGDAVLTTAMVDRLTHKAVLVDMNGESYRIKETRAQQAALRRDNN